MDDVIRKGDLVMIVRGRTMGCECTYASRITGFVFKVDSLSNRISRCSACKTPLPAAARAVWIEKNWEIELYRLKKINPPAMTTETSTEREVCG